MRSTYPLAVVLLTLAACSTEDTDDPDEGQADSIAQIAELADFKVTDFGQIEAEGYRDGKLGTSEAHLFHMKTFGPGEFLRAYTVPDNAHLLGQRPDENARTRILLYRWNIDDSAWDLLDEVGRNALGGWSEAETEPETFLSDYAMAVTADRPGYYAAGWKCRGTACTAAQLDSSCRFLDWIYELECKDSSNPRACTAAADLVTPPLTKAEHVDLCCSMGPFKDTAAYCALGAR